MGIWKDKARGDWRYSFEFQKKTFAGGGYNTKTEARTAREDRRKEVKAQQKETIQTGMGFLETANQYMDWSGRRHAPGHVENKKVVFRKLIKFFGVNSEADLPISSLHHPSSTNSS